MNDPIVGIPPYQITQVMTASEMKEQLDWGQIALGLDVALKRTKGRDLKIAVLDTGIDRVHATSGDMKDAVLDARDFTGSPFGFWDEPNDGHGTHTSSTIGARADGSGIVGWAPECELLIGKVLRSGTGSNATVAAGLRWARKAGANFISMSLGSPQSSPELAFEIEACGKEGIFIFAAAGNTGRPDDVNFPARYKKPNGHPFLDTMAIAALMSQNGTLILAPYSSRGPEVDFAFPGSGVLGCWLNGGYARIDGTSMATPAACGAAALLYAIHLTSSGTRPPIRTLDDFRDRFRKYTKDIGDAGEDDGSGWGFVNVGEMIGKDVEVAPPTVPPVVPPPTTPPTQPPDQDEGFSFGPFTVRSPAKDGDWLGINIKV